jgi:transposase InsO family protein
MAIEFKSWAQDYGISIDYASVAHPQANGQVERANGLILGRPKPRLYEDLKDYDSKWIDELPKTVWGLRCTPKLVEQQGTHLSFWYMALKLCYQQL